MQSTPEAAIGPDANSDVQSQRLNPFESKFKLTVQRIRDQESRNQC
jgi:hypothetical protein